jgi:hypothetical protein
MPGFQELVHNVWASKKSVVSVEIGEKGNFTKEFGPQTDRFPFVANTPLMVRTAVEGFFKEFGLWNTALTVDSQSPTKSTFKGSNLKINPMKFFEGIDFHSFNIIN